MIGWARNGTRRIPLRRLRVSERGNAIRLDDSRRQLSRQMVVRSPDDLQPPDRAIVALEIVAGDVAFASCNQTSLSHLVTVPAQI